MNKLTSAVVSSSIMFLLSAIAQAGSATWDLNPGSGDWNTARNWTPATVPNGSADTATFDFSNTTNVSISIDTEVNGIVFPAGATNPYTITELSNSGGRPITLRIDGGGIANNSGITQSFVVTGLDSIAFFNATAGTSTTITTTGSGRINFTNSSAGNATITNMSDGGTNFYSSTAASATIYGGFNKFYSSTAGNATIYGGLNNFLSGTAGNATIYGSNNQFVDGATAENATITNTPGTFTLFRGSFGTPTTAGDATIINYGGVAFFPGQGPHSAPATAGNATIINNAGANTGFGEGTTADSATIINNGGTSIGAHGGFTFFGGASAGSATLIANGGTNGGLGGSIQFSYGTKGGTSRVEVFGNGNLDISFEGSRSHEAPSVTIGSIEGDGNVFLGGNNLTVGSNNMDTTFSGVIQDGGQNGGTGGSLTKIGSGTLDLTGTNTYTGATRVGGMLKVDGSITSNTFVHSGGTLAGTGTVHSDVANNGGTVSPGDSPGTLTITGGYSQQASATLMIDIAGSSLGQYSVLNVFGNASLRGFLDPVLLNGFIPTVGEQFIFLKYGSFFGSFSSIQNQTFNGGTEHWDITYGSTSAILVAEAGPATNTPDSGSTMPLLTLSFVGLVMLRRQWLGKRE
jgi:autotransporter-associated beta strand protein